MTKNENFHGARPFCLTFSLRGTIVPCRVNLYRAMRFCRDANVQGLHTDRGGRRSETSIPRRLPSAEFRREQSTGLHGSRRGGQGHQGHSSRTSLSRQLHRRLPALQRAREGPRPGRDGGTHRPGPERFPSKAGWKRCSRVIFLILTRFRCLRRRVSTRESSGNTWSRPWNLAISVSVEPLLRRLLAPFSSSMPKVGPLAVDWLQCEDARASPSFLVDASRFRRVSGRRPSRLFRERHVHEQAGDFHVHLQGRIFGRLSGSRSPRTHLLRLRCQLFSLQLSRGMLHDQRRKDGLQVPGMVLGCQMPAQHERYYSIIKTNF